MARPLMQKEIAERVRAYKGGMPISQMAKKYRTSRNAIYNFLRRRGVKIADSACPTCGREYDPPKADAPADPAAQT